jgi:hypothetical protein
LNNSNILLSKAANLNNDGMKNLHIDSPCTENWSEMTSTERGAHCKKCATEVFDFTNKSNPEIRFILLDKSGQSLCGRYTTDQYESLNTDYDAWKFNSKRSMQRAMVFSLVVVFGLTLFSCTDKQEAKSFTQLQNSIVEMSSEDPVEELISEVQAEQFLPVRAKTESSVKFVENTIETVLEIEDRELNLQEVVCSGRDQLREVTDRISYTMGMSILSGSYEEYLKVPVALENEELIQKIELDRNGVEYPKEFSSKVYPNPAREATSLEIASPLKQEQVVIRLYDMTGKQLRGIHGGEMERGTFTYPLDLNDLQPGMYLIIIHSAGFKETVRVSKS